MVTFKLFCSTVALALFGLSFAVKAQTIRPFEPNVIRQGPRDNLLYPNGTVHENRSTQLENRGQAPPAETPEYDWDASSSEACGTKDTGDSKAIDNVFAGQGEYGEKSSDSTASQQAGPPSNC